MRIKAVGIIKENLEDGHTIKVDWFGDYRTTMKEWYFYTSRFAIWMLDYKSDSRNSHLIEFALNDVEQDYSVFLYRDYWKNQFYTDEQFQKFETLQQEQESENQFAWVHFYQEFADKLRPYFNDRDTLIEKVIETYKAINMKLPTLERESNIVDIDPFTIFALFNKGQGS